MDQSLMWQILGVKGLYVLVIVTIVTHKGGWRQVPCSFVANLSCSVAPGSELT
jgi:hypothetical protein